MADLNDDEMQVVDRMREKGFLVYILSPDDYVDIPVDEVEEVIDEAAMNFIADQLIFCDG